MFKIVEDRRNGIKNTIFFGSYERCCAWMYIYTNPYGSDIHVRVSTNPENVNSNGDYFIYTIEPVVDE